jgi:hypothetical protein
MSGMRIRETARDKVLKAKCRTIASGNNSMWRLVCMVIVGDGNNSIYISE